MIFPGFSSAESSAGGGGNCFATAIGREGGKEDIQQDWGSNKQRRGGQVIFTIGQHVIMVQIHSAEEDSEDSQELPVDPQAAVLATSANQVKSIQTVQNMTRNSLPPHEAFLGVLWGVLKWVPFWNTLVLRLLNWSKVSRYWTLSRQRPQNMASCYGLFRHFP